MESFRGSMQIELLNRQRWRTTMELGLAKADDIEHFYNSDGRCRSLGYLTANKFEDLHSTTTHGAMVVVVVLPLLELVVEYLGVVDDRPVLGAGRTPRRRCAETSLPCR